MPAATEGRRGKDRLPQSLARDYGPTSNLSAETDFRFLIFKLKRINFYYFKSQVSIHLLELPQKLDTDFGPIFDTLV